MVYLRDFHNNGSCNKGRKEIASRTALSMRLIDDRYAQMAWKGVEEFGVNAYEQQATIGGEWMKKKAAEKLYTLYLT
jgi:hypothetical protein